MEAEEYEDFNFYNSVYELEETKAMKKKRDTTSSIKLDISW